MYRFPCFYLKFLHCYLVALPYTRKRLHFRIVSYRFVSIRDVSWSLKCWKININEFCQPSIPDALFVNVQVSSHTNVTCRAFEYNSSLKTTTVRLPIGSHPFQHPIPRSRDVNKRNINRSINFLIDVHFYAVITRYVRIILFPNEIFWPMDDIAGVELSR